jgi:hypothetical protein
MKVKEYRDLLSQQLKNLANAAPEEEVEVDVKTV